MDLSKRPAAIRILLVDDHRSVLWGLAKLIESAAGLELVATCSCVDSAAAALRQQVENFSQFYDIGGTLSADQEIVVPAKLYDEILYIVREGLSNIRRHTAARRASVTLRREAGRLRIEIANDNAAEGLAPFHPRSIAERARELGGRVAVELRPGRESVVAVQVPF